MNPELRRYIRESILDRAAIRHIQTMLPDDAELDRWLEQTAADYEGNEFVCLVIAALGAGRQVDARHLAIPVCLPWITRIGGCLSIGVTAKRAMPEPTRW